MIIKYICVILLFFALFGCHREADLVLINKTDGSDIDFPMHVDLQFRGFKIGEAERISKDGNYNVFFIDSISSDCNADYFLVKEDVFGHSCYFEVTQISQTVNHRPSSDTCYYLIQNQPTLEKIDGAVDLFNELLDTLANIKNENQTPK